ncbi:MAG: TonB-dependent receptor [Ignavibacteriae bacterium]|nr:TonB-dependent receptor [Ignavibacteriota bacterium]NOH00305.1 TonB-dependent receptor [Ignavibacteriota bacterium]
MKHLFNILFFIILPSLLFSQSDSINVELKEIVVTATKTESPQIRIASSITVISEQQILNTNKNSVLEILRDVEGVSIAQQGGPGRLSSAYIRGANPDQTLVLIDGVEVNDPGSANNSYDFSSLQTENIQRIEVLRGPQSTLYGSDAMAGVINILTKKGKGEPKFSLSAEGGSNNYYKGAASANGEFKGFNYLLSFSRLKSDGFSAINKKYNNAEKDGYSNNSILSKIGYNFNDKVGVDFIYKYSFSEAELDQSSKTGDDPNYNYDFEQQLLKGNVNLNLFEGKVDQRVGASFTKTISNAVDEFDELNPNTSSTNYTRGNRIKFDFQNDFHILENNVITLGFETEEEKAENTYSSISEFGPYENALPLSKVRTSSVYLQDQINFGNALFITAGGRYDSHEKFGSEITYRIAGTYLFSKTGTKIKATYGTGFKAPALFDLFDPSFGNPELEAEKSRGFDFGFEQFLMNDVLHFGAAYFEMDIDNLIGFDENFKAVNINEVKTSGVEMFAAVPNIFGISFNGNYTFTNSKDNSTGSPDNGLVLLRRPKHKLSLNLNYNFNEALNFNLGFRFVGEREDKDFSTFPVERVILDSYSIVDFSAAYNINGLIKVYGRVENLFNADYEEILFYGTMERAGYLGASLSL